MTNDAGRKPAYRVMCARITGRDRNGREILGNFREIGAVWAPNPEKKWFPVALDLTPQELINGEARLFLAPVEDSNGS